MAVTAATAIEPTVNFNTAGYEIRVTEAHSPLFA